MRRVATGLALTGVLGLSACAVQPPSGPSFAAMPGSGKSYEQFQMDDAQCRDAGHYASGNPAAAKAGTDQAVGNAVVGTALGAAAGALIGSATGQVGAGAAVGAGVGLLAGSAAGANSASVSQYQLQRNYDIAYAQCMAAKGEAVPPVASPEVGAYPSYPAYPTYAPAYPPAYMGPPPYYYGPPAGVGIGVGYGWRRPYYW